MTQGVVHSTCGPVLWLRLNAVERRNVLTDDVKQALLADFDAVRSNPEIQAVVLTGAGFVFSCGEALEDIDAAAGRSYGEMMRSGYNRVIRTMRAVGKPIVAAVNGITVGSGVSLALASDLRIASDKAMFAAPFLDLGLIPDGGATYFLPRLVGTAKAFEMFAMRRTILSEEANRIGLVDAVVPHEALEREAQTWAERLACIPSLAFALLKRMMFEAPAATLDEALEMEASMQEIAGRSEDHRRAVRVALAGRLGSNG